MAITIGLVLIGADSLYGLTLWGEGPVMVEVIPFALVSAVIGYRSGRRGGPANSE
jgi:hypothetical protein